MDKHISTYNESALHDSLKAYYKGDNGLSEVAIKGYYVDVLRDGTIYEIQTANLGAMKRKLSMLITDWPVVVVYPIPAVKWITRIDDQGKGVYRRRSPKKGTGYDVFKELIYLAPLLPNPAITIALAFVEVEEERYDDGKGSWRRKGVSIVDRKLLSIQSTQMLSDPEEYRSFLQLDEKSPFTTADIKRKLSVSASLASRIAYFLRKTQMSEFIGKTERKHLYRWRAESDPIRSGFETVKGERGETRKLYNA